MIHVGAMVLVYGLATAMPVDTAHVVDSTVVVEPLGVAFQVPPAWLGGQNLRAPAPTCAYVVRGPIDERVHLDRATFSTLLHATGEWDHEYSAVIDSVMPFGSLVAHLGPEPWGARGSCYADLQMRVHVTDLAAADIGARNRRPTRRVRLHAHVMARGRSARSRCRSE